MELYGRGGDSLQGRYYSHHLHSLTLSEVSNTKFFGLDLIFKFPREAKKHDRETLITLMRLGEFPEPFLGGSDADAARWCIAYDERLVREDIRDLEKIQEIEKMELLVDQLTLVAGSILSVNSLREDLEVSFDSVRKTDFDSRETFCMFSRPTFWVT